MGFKYRLDKDDRIAAFVEALKGCCGKKADELGQDVYSAVTEYNVYVNDFIEQRSEEIRFQYEKLRENMHPDLVITLKFYQQRHDDLMIEFSSLNEEIKSLKEQLNK